MRSVLRYWSSVDSDSATEPAGPESDTVSVVRGGPAGGRPFTPLAVGTEVGRYVILGEAGAGGMGIVYSAYDPALDRKVALKLVRGQAEGSLVSVSAGTRLQREAQALAKLSHPNIVTAFDVGPYGDDVFLAMEFIVGQTLREWLNADVRAWQEVVDVALDAGRGLAAAHAAGLVHRDVKPSNILVTEDGRGLVTDFGLVQSQSAPDTRPTEAFAGTLVETALETQPTAHGEIMGTPSYMSLEQHRGEDVGPASDQFGFCVMLYEALYGIRPFAGESLVALLKAVSEGTIQAPRQNVGPRKLLDAVQKGLHPQADQRHTSMDELIAILDGFRHRWRRGWVVAASLALVAAAGGGYAAASGTGASNPTPRCDGGPAQWAQVWNKDTAVAIDTAFRATKKAYAADASDRVLQFLDDYGERWIEQHRETCAATRIREEQSEELLDLRMACLDRRRAGVKALVRHLRTPQDGTVRRAAKATYSLSPVEDCANVEALLADVAPPADEATRQSVAEVRAILDDAEALSRTGQYTSALARAEEGVTAARQVDYPPLQAEGLLCLGGIQSDRSQFDDATTTLQDAMFAAEHAGAIEVAGDASRLLAYATGQKGNLEQAQLWAKHTTALFADRHLSPTDQVDLLSLHAVLAFWSSKASDAESLLRQAIDLAAGEGPTGRLKTLQSNLGAALAQQGRYEEAISPMEDSVAIARQLWGESHPETGSTYLNYGALQVRIGRYREARDVLRRAESIWTAVDPTSHWQGLVMSNLAHLHFNLGDPEQALVFLRREEESVQVSRKGNTSAVASHLFIRAMAYTDLGRFEEARALLERAGAMLRDQQPQDPYADLPPRLGLARIDFERGQYETSWRTLRGLSDPVQEKWGTQVAAELAAFQESLGRAAWRAGHLDDARASLQRALEIRQPKFPIAIPTLVALAETELAAGQLDAAETAAAQARALAADEDVGPHWLAQLDFAEARILWAHDRHSGALALARRAQRTQRKAEYVHHGDARRVRRWLAARGEAPAPLEGPGPPVEPTPTPETAEELSRP